MSTECCVGRAHLQRVGVVAISKTATLEDSRVETRMVTASSFQLTAVKYFKARCQEQSQFWNDVA
jgi:hypothetical protein